MTSHCDGPSRLMHGSAATGNVHVCTHLFNTSISWNLEYAWTTLHPISKKGRICPEARDLASIYAVLLVLTQITVLEKVTEQSQIKEETWQYRSTQLILAPISALVGNIISKTNIHCQEMDLRGFCGFGNQELFCIFVSIRRLIMSNCGSQHSLRCLLRSHYLIIGLRVFSNLTWQIFNLPK